MPVTHYRQCV